MTKRKGFTLIELLVAIAIIAMLMAIMVPVLGRVKEHARNLLCRTNLHQYGLAERMYLDNNDGYFPTTFDWLFWDAEGRGDLGPGGCQWHNASIKRDGTLWPYLKDKQIHLCPTFKSYANAVFLDSHVEQVCAWNPPDNTFKLLRPNKK